MKCFKWQPGKPVFFAAVLVLLSFLSFCVQYDNQVPATLTDPINAPATSFFNAINSTVNLPASGAQTEVPGLIIDLNGDGLGDGLDLNNDGTPELLFITSTDLTRVGMDIDGDGDIDYFISALSDGSIEILDETLINATSGTYTIAVDESGNILGIDVDGDGQADDSRLDSIYTDTQSPTLSTGTFSGVFPEAVEVYFTCSDDYACNHIHYNVEGPSGESSGAVVDFDGPFLAGDGPPGDYLITYYAVDYAGNRGVSQQLALTITGLTFSVDFTAGSQTDESGSAVDVEIALSFPPNAPVTIPVKVGDNSEGSASLSQVVLDDSTMSAIVTITGVNDHREDGDQDYQITVGPTSSADDSFDSLSAQKITVTNADDDTSGISVTPEGGLVTSEAGASDTFDVVLDTKPTGDVVIGFATQSGTTDQVSVSPASVTFSPSNWNSPQTVTITGQDDAGADATSEGENILITVDSDATKDSIYAALSGLPVPDVLNVDDDSANIIINPVDSSNLNIGQTYNIDFSLASIPASNVTITFTNPDNTTLSLSDTNLVFTNADYDTIQTLQITAIDSDDIAEGISNLSVSLGVTGDPAYAALTPDNIAVTVNDDDTAGLVTAGTAGLATSEDGTPASFDVALTSEPSSGSVTINLSVNNPGEGMLTGATTLTFTSSDWSIPQPVDLAGVDDSAVPVRDGTQTYQVTLNPSGPSEYAALGNSTVNVQNRDNERYFFLSTAFSTGNLGGVGGADNTCNTDPNRPDNGATYKAMLTDGTSRIATTSAGTATGQTDWVLEAGRNYMRVPPETNVRIFQADSNALYPITGTDFENPIASTTGKAWTGFKSNWVSSVNDCNGWMSGQNSKLGMFGKQNLTDSDAISFTSSHTCDTSKRLYCVEQP